MLWEGEKPFGYDLASLIIFSISYFTLAFQKMPVKYLLVSIVRCGKIAGLLREWKQVFKVNVFYEVEKPQRIIAVVTSIYIFVQNEL